MLDFRTMISLLVIFVCWSRIFKLLLAHNKNKQTPADFADEQKDYVANVLIPFKKNIMDTYNPDSLVFVHFYLSPLKELLHNDFPISKVSTCIYIQSNKIIFQDLFNKNLHFEFAFDEFSSYDLTKPQKSRPQFDITLYKKKNKYEKKSVFFTFYTAPFVPERDQEFADILNPQPFIDLIKKHVEPLFDPYNY